MSFFLLLSLVTFLLIKVREHTEQRQTNGVHGLGRLN